MPSRQERPSLAPNGHVRRLIMSAIRVERTCLKANFDKGQSCRACVKIVMSGHGSLPCVDSANPSALPDIHIFGTLDKNGEALRAWSPSGTAVSSPRPAFASSSGCAGFEELSCRLP